MVSFYISTRRFYYQPYSPPSDNMPASHENLLRMYYQTEANAGEYDIPKCDPAVSPDHCVHEISAHFKVSDMLRVRRRYLQGVSQTKWDLCSGLILGG